MLKCWLHRDQFRHIVYFLISIALHQHTNTHACAHIIFGTNQLFESTQGFRSFLWLLFLTLVKKKKTKIKFTVLTSLSVQFSTWSTFTLVCKRSPEHFHLVKLYLKNKKQTNKKTSVFIKQLLSISHSP